MNLFLTNNWLLLVNSLVFWLTPVALAINLTMIDNKPPSYKKRISYFYGMLWAIAFAIYFAVFLY